MRIVIDELKTVLEYKEYLEHVDCPKCRDVINDIIDEEYVHAGEALEILLRDDRFRTNIEKGRAEAAEKMDASPMIRL